MQCPNCSTEIASGNFCPNCGSPLPTMKAEESVPEEPVVLDAVPVGEPEEPFTPPTYNHAPGQGGTQGGFVPPVPPVGGAEDTPSTPAYGTSSDGILNQAWDDVIHDPSKVRTLALLGLIELVPILNFASIGYSLRWGRRAAFRTGDKLPRKIFGDHAFSTGFYAVVVLIVWAFVLGLISAVPLVGAIVAILAAPFLQLALGYLAMTEEIGAGFRLGQLWEIGKRSYGGLIALTYVPGLIVGVVASIVLAIGMIPMGVSAVGLYDIAQYGATGTAMSVLSLSGALFFVILVIMYICGILSAIARLISTRALGYWMGRMAPEWVQESVQNGTDPR